MVFKQKRDNDKPAVQSAEELKMLLSANITTYESAEIAILHLMKSHDFTLGLLQQILTEGCIDISFSNVQFEDIAPFIGLHTDSKMTDIETFHVRRSRMPTALFKSIMEDIDGMLVQYGPPIEHQTEEATSQFLSPIFNHLITIFCFALRNRPGSIIEGRITRKGRVEYYFKAIHSIAILVIEVKLKIGSAKERMNAVAQVVAECDACDWNNKRNNFRVPVYGILCDGDSFEFFRFIGFNDTSKLPSFEHGLRPDDPPNRQRPFRIPDPSDPLCIHSFINALRPISKIIFDLLLKGYVTSLQAYHDHSANASTCGGQPRKSLDKWQQALSAAAKAAQDFGEAEVKRQAGHIDEADKMVDGAMVQLKESIDAVPINKPESIMSGWDDKEVEKV